MNKLYRNVTKRILDIVLSLIAIALLSPVYLILTILGAAAMKGKPFFCQPRPGMIDPKTGQERIFRMVKFRSMTEEKDSSGQLLPEEKRLTRYGSFLRKSSLDELPEFFAVLAGKMSLVGPRPQLVWDMMYMTKEQRKRHTVRPGITGLAQVSGRNAIDWDRKLALDLKYIGKIRFTEDLKIVLRTFATIFRTDYISTEGTQSVQNYADYLMEKGAIGPEEYMRGQEKATGILNNSQKP